ncbi:MAG: hypothetical protein KGP28_05015 [Bdellovibrionales bacterium]|nr:hypothetical protein [Bdellovibrionales bacterium]
MNLALGKFSVENFSRYSRKFTSVEVELKSYLLWDARDRQRFRTWIGKKEIGVIPRISLRTSRSREEFRDLMSAAREEFEGRFRFFLIASGRKRFDQEQDLRSRKEFSISIQNEGVDLCFEWGEEDTPMTTSWIPAAFPKASMMLDLDCHWKFREKVPQAIHFKLHGWHPERWMRRYGETLIRKFQKRMGLDPEAILILAHSGRIEEAPEFA